MLFLNIDNLQFEDKIKESRLKEIYIFKNK